jgi:hypothetical protein
VGLLYALEERVVISVDVQPQRGRRAGARVCPARCFFIWVVAEDFFPVFKKKV